MVNLNGVKEAYSRGVAPLIEGFNSLLAGLIPGKLEFVVIAMALFIGWQFRKKRYARGGWNYWLKVSLIVYLVLKVLGFGTNLMNLIQI